MTPVPPVTRPVPPVTTPVPPATAPVPPVTGPVPPVTRRVPPVSRPVQPVWRVVQQVRRPVQPVTAVGRRRRGRGTARDQAWRGVWENADSSCLWERGEALAGDLISRPSSQRSRRPHQQQWSRLYQTSASEASRRGDRAADRSRCRSLGCPLRATTTPPRPKDPRRQETVRSGQGTCTERVSAS